jgi:membrane-associated phospholipid phosphatase
LGIAGGLMFAALAIAIGLSRVALGEHPIAEVIAGLFCALPFLLLARPTIRRHRRGHEAALLYTIVIVALLAEFSGLRFHQEQRFFLSLQSWL